MLVKKKPPPTLSSAVLPIISPSIIVILSDNSTINPVFWYAVFSNILIFSISTVYDPEITRPAPDFLEWFSNKCKSFKIIFLESFIIIPP